MIDNQRTGSGLRECDGAEQAAEQRVQRGIELTAARQRLSANHAASAASGSGENDWQLVHCYREESRAGVHDVQQFAGKLDRNIPRNRCAGWRGQHAGNVGHDVLGRGVPGRAFHLHHSAEHLPRRSRRRVEDIQYSVPDAGASTKLNALNARTAS